MKTKLVDYIFEESSDEAFQELEEFIAGGVPGPMLPLGAKGAGADEGVEKGFWRNKAGKQVKTASPKLHKKGKKKPLSLQEISQDLFEFETNTDRGMARLWADQPDVESPEQSVKSDSPLLDKDIKKNYSV